MNLPDLIAKLYEQSEVPWNGYLYRSSREAGGHLYHTDPLGAKYYLNNHPDNRLRIYTCPNVKTAYIDTDSGDSPPTPTVIDGVTHISVAYLYKITNNVDSDDDWVNILDQALPILTKHFPAITIFGETGAEVWGYPVEIALATNPPETREPHALATLIEQ